MQSSKSPEKYTLVRMPQAVERKELRLPTLPESVSSVEDSPTRSLMARKGKRRVPRFRRGKSSKSTSRFSAGQLPPPLSVTPAYRTRYRFSNTVGQTGTNVTYGTLACVPGGVVTVLNTTFTSFSSSLRIHGINIWTPANAAAGVAEVIWEPSSAIPMEKDDSKISSIPAGITVSGALRFRPPRSSLCGYWMSSNVGTSTVLFKITAPLGSIIELDLSYTLANNIGAVAASISTGALGAIAYGNIPLNTPVFLQLGRPNTVS